MTVELQQLVQDTARCIGTSPPDLLGRQSPTLSSDSLASQGFYVIGLIGGKEVGKSALVNALVGEPITQTTSFGPGTETVIAYAHEAHLDELRALLEREAPGQFRIVTHRIERLGRQVLLDLPDIDSVWTAHVQLTRRMLRHMLFPLWVQSVEKYADRQPQQLLAQVAEGNAAANFIFCLNKSDQLNSAGNGAALEELRQDYSQRIGRTLAVPPPRVWMLSAARPEQYELPALRQLLSQQKSTELVQQSQLSASRQQDKSLAGWIEAQDLRGRANRLNRLHQEAQELLAARVGTSLLEKSLPALVDDPASQLALTDEVLSLRVHHWPIVNLVHALLVPVLAIIRRNVGINRTVSLPDAEALVEAHLQPAGTTLATLVRSIFAQLQQMHQEISVLYARRKLWEDMPADSAVVQLRTRLSLTIATQRDTIRQRLAGRRAILTAPLRWLLTIGALLWFPFLQPITEALLNQGMTHSSHDLVLLAVRIFSVSALLENLTFLAMYYFVLWLILRWDTHRRVVRLVSKWKQDSSDLSLASQTVDWLEELLGPIRGAKENIERLSERAEKLLGG